LVLVVLSAVEQRLHALRALLAGASVVEVAAARWFDFPTCTHKPTPACHRVTLPAADEFNVTQD
jgi:hypothetical protein